MRLSAAAERVACHRKRKFTAGAQDSGYLLRRMSGPTDTTDIRTDGHSPMSIDSDGQRNTTREKIQHKKI